MKDETGAASKAYVMTNGAIVHPQRSSSLQRDHSYTISGCLYNSVWERMPESVKCTDNGGTDGFLGLSTGGVNEHTVSIHGFCIPMHIIETTPFT